MKPVFFFVLFSLLYSHSQAQNKKQLERNSKQQSQPAPVKVVDRANESFAISFIVTDTLSYIEITGMNLGSATIDKEDSIILTLSNEQKLAFSAAGLQTFVPSLKGNTYEHRYHFTTGSLSQLKEHPVT